MFHYVFILFYLVKNTQNKDKSITIINNNTSSQTFIFLPMKDIII